MHGNTSLSGRRNGTVAFKEWIKNNRIRMKKVFRPVIALACMLSVHFTGYGQNEFIYEKGKSFHPVAASPFGGDTLRFDRLNEGVYYEKQLPANTRTVAFSIGLPAYRRGLFFSRDTRGGDYQWPNNTNRLLPWAFDKLADLADNEYPGIPSNGRPSLAGDALLLELENGEFLFAKAVAGANSLSWFEIGNDGALTVYLSTLGEDDLPARAPVLLSARDRTVYGVFRHAYGSLIADREVSFLRKRADKAYFEAFEYLGWCSWEHYHMDIDEAKLLHDLDGIEASGLPVRYVLIDDGHVASKNRQLTGFVPDKRKFPTGWEPIMARKNDARIKWIGLWYNFCGYWLGISPENDLPEPVGKTLYSFNGSLLPGRSEENIQAFYRYYVETLKAYGFDFLKIDNQAFMLPLYMGGAEAVRQAKACNRALEEQTRVLGMGLMNCMAQNTLNLDNTRYSSVARVSIDYKKFDRDMAKSHLFQSYTNTLLQGQTVWPDHDMFHSSDSICGALMARSKALSGGPVYLSDAPAGFVKENILPLIDEAGRLFRPQAPAVPTPESVFVNPLRSGRAYRVFAPTGDYAVSLICYNLNTDPAFRDVVATVSESDYFLREAMTGRKTPSERRLILYDWENRTAEELTGEKPVALTGFTDRLFHLCPVIDGWAVIGLQEKFLSPATVKIRSCSARKLKLEVLAPGTLKVWKETGDKQEVLDITVSEPHAVIILRK